MILVIAGVLMAVAIPRFFDKNVFQSRGFADQVQTSLRYAQKLAIAQRRNVCVRLASNSVTLTAPACGGVALNFPAGSNSITAPSGVTLAPAVDISFDALGRTSAQQIILVSGATNSIIVEAETGYVHSP